MPEIESAGLHSLNIGHSKNALIKNGKTILSGIDPAGRAEKTADAVSIKDGTLYFCPSPLYGFGLERLLSHLETQAPNSAVLCLEADPELYELTQRNINPGLLTNKKLHITNVCKKEELAGIVRNLWGGRAFRRIQTIRFTGGWQLSSELYNSLCEELRSEIATDWSNALTLSKLGRLYIRNTLRNLSNIANFSSIGDLSFGSSASLVLGAGPSLDETLDALEKHFAENIYLPETRPFKIICVDTCLPALNDRKIKSDLVIILESQHWNLRDFIGSRIPGIPAAIDISSLPASVQLLNAEGYLFMTPWTSLRIFERLKSYGLLPVIIPPLGSVGLTAVEIARRITSGIIICAGLDFSFTPDKYHARGTPAHRSKLNSLSRFRSVLNTAAYDSHSLHAVSKSGLKVISNPVMRNYRSLFEQEFGGDSRLYDITGSGLPLGVKTLLLDDAVKMLAGSNLEPTQICTHTNDAEAQVRRICGRNHILFLEGELNRLEELRGILTGEIKAGAQRLGVLIDECDYLWAHFPDYSGGRRSDINDISFLKRVRTEIDPMLKLIERVKSFI